MPRPARPIPIHIQADDGALRRMGRRQLVDLAAAANDVRLCQRVLDATGDNLVGEILGHARNVAAWEHHPPGDAFDAVTHSQFYYHCHPPDERPFPEHGHFHLFLRPKGMPPAIAPAPVADVVPPAGDNDALSHLVAISMDDSGRATRLFTTNRWVTGETWYKAADICRMLDRFAVKAAPPGPVVVARWLTAMVRLYGGDIARLLHARDSAIAACAAQDPGANVHENRALDVASFMNIDIAARCAAVDSALASQNP
jgi:hypothetical protein